MQQVGMKATVELLEAKLGDNWRQGRGHSTALSSRIASLPGLGLTHIPIGHSGA